MSTDLNYSTESISPEATSELGSRLAAKLNGDETMVLVGDLGAGKTQFVRGLVSALGSDETVQSPTFTLSREYVLTNGKQLHHYDFYRLGEAGVLGQEFEESIADPNVITVAEWADIVESALPEGVIIINLTATSETTRIINSNLELT